METKKTIIEETYNINHEWGRALVRTFEKEFEEYKGKTRTMTQVYQEQEIKTVLRAREVYLLEKGAIVFVGNECGYRVVPEVFRDISEKMKALDQLLARREWAKNNL